MREYYDQWDAFSAPLRWKGRIKELTTPQLIRWADRLSADPERPKGVHHLADRHRTARTVGRHHVGAAASAAAATGRIAAKATSDYIFAVSRLAPLKRLSLLIEALANPEAAGIRCVIAGEGEEHQALEHAIATRGLSSRVKLIGRIDDRADAGASGALPRGLLSSV